MNIRIQLGTLAILVLFFGCDSQNGDSSPTDGDTCPPGAETCPCLPEDKCDEGLICLSNTCVQIPGDMTDGDIADGDDSPDVDGDTDLDDSGDSEAEEEETMEAQEEESEADLMEEDEENAEDDTETGPHYGSAVFFNSLEVAPEHCCVDVDGNGGFDNQIGLLFDTFGTFDFVNDEIQEKIDSGYFAHILEFGTVDDWQNASAISMKSYIGKDADDDYQDNLEPTHGGEFVVIPDYYDTETELPYEIADATITEGVIEFTAETLYVPGHVLELGIASVSDVPLPHARLKNAIVKGTISQVADDDGELISIVNGVIGAAVSPEEIYAMENEFVRSHCACLSATEPMIDLETQSCNTNIQPDQCHPDDPCSSRTTFCQLLVSNVRTSLDVDTTGDSFDDSLSIGLKFTAIPARIVGEYDASTEDGDVDSDEEVELDDDAQDGDGEDAVE